MLLDHLDLLFKCIVGLILFATVCAGYAYYVNARRSKDDPGKRNYHPAAILFARITLPAFLLFSIAIFILKVLAYGIFLLVFAFTILIVRKSFLLTWLHKTMTAIGNISLEANTLLIKFFVRTWINHP
ncbi:MAG TPA: hypothetical protein VK249_06010 [Anaerolineales bacterium]|nr:hypothetical protein [Anaerolineales bacterium]